MSDLAGDLRGQGEGPLVEGLVGNLLGEGACDLAGEGEGRPGGHTGGDDGTMSNEP